MAFVKGHKQSVGNKGGGRKSTTEEWIKASVINKSWAFLLEEMENKKTKDDRKFQISLEVAKKTIPKEIKVDATLTLNKLKDLIE